MKFTWNEFAPRERTFETPARQLLACLLLNPSAASKSVQMLEPYHFPEEDDRVMFVAIMDALRSGRRGENVLEIVLRSEAVRKHCDTRYLVNLVQLSPTTSHSEYYAKQIKGVRTE